METILLAWNPNRFPWGDLEDELAQVRRKGRVTRSWSVGNRKSLDAGVRFFLIRLGVEPRGLVGSGWTTSVPFEDLHWDHDRAERGETAFYAEIYFDVLQEEPVVAMAELEQKPFMDTHWSTQMSGISIEPKVSQELEILWSNRTTNSDPLGLEELPVATETTKKHSSRVYVNRYERSSRARALCLAHYGLECSCCGTLQEDVYGAPANRLIHVHHLSPLSELPEGYEIDPIRDLRPVCPNCHAVIHTKNPPYEIKDIKRMIEDSRMER